jgi:hypothetical protein
VHRHGFGMARHSPLVESTASRCCEPDKISEKSVAAQPWQNVQYTANGHKRFGDAHGVTKEKLVILNSFTSNKKICQAQSTSPNSSAKRQADERTHARAHAHTPLRQPQINKNFKTQYLMLYIKNQPI